jgi:hypothetical protein
MTQFCAGKISSAEIKTWTDFFVEPIEPIYIQDMGYMPDFGRAERHVIL